MKTIIFIIAAFLALGAVGWLISLYNSLVQVQNNIGKAWKNIDVLLLQRNEEIPKLAEIVKAGMKYEEEILWALTTLRLAYRNAQDTSSKTTVENQIREQIRALYAAGERYPELKASTLYQQAMDRISALEAAISDRRAFFNETVMIYNIRIKRFPELVFARLVGFCPHPYLNSSPANLSKKSDKTS
jgi:LemA protein